MPPKLQQAGNHEISRHLLFLCVQAHAHAKSFHLGTFRPATGPHPCKCPPNLCPCICTSPATIWCFPSTNSIGCELLQGTRCARGRPQAAQGR